jgi:hypothetical protein
VKANIETGQANSRTYSVDKVLGLDVRLGGGVVVEGLARLLHAIVGATTVTVGGVGKLLGRVLGTALVGGLVGAQIVGVGAGVDGVLGGVQVVVVHGVAVGVVVIKLVVAARGGLNATIVELLTTSGVAVLIVLNILVGIHGVHVKHLLLTLKVQKRENRNSATR